MTNAIDLIEEMLENETLPDEYRDQAEKILRNHQEPAATPPAKDGRTATRTNEAPLRYFHCESYTSEDPEDQEGREPDAMDIYCIPSHLPDDHDRPEATFIVQVAQGHGSSHEMRVRAQFLVDQGNQHGRLATLLNDLLADLDGKPGLAAWCDRILKDLADVSPAATPLSILESEQEAMELAGALSDAADGLQKRGDWAAYAAIEDQYGGPGALGDWDELWLWCEENPDQAEDFLSDLQAEVADPGSRVPASPSDPARDAAPPDSRAS